jgi:hypothetical protein
MRSSRMRSSAPAALHSGWQTKQPLTATMLVSAWIPIV